MSRSGYSDDYDDNGQGWLWRGCVSRAMNGKRGQAALVELLRALETMPVKALAAESLVTEGGEFCTLGVLGAERGLDMTTFEPDDCDAVAKALGIAPAMVREIVFENDEGFSIFHNDTETPENRWQRMRCWVAAAIQVKGDSA